VKTNVVPLELLTNIPLSSVKDEPHSTDFTLVMFMD